MPSSMKHSPVATGPRGDAIGHQIRAPSLKDDGTPLSAASPQSGEWRQIVGVVADSRNNGLEQPTAPAIFVPYTTFMWDNTQLLIRTANSPLASLKAVRIALHSVNAEQRTDDGESTTSKRCFSANQYGCSSDSSPFCSLSLPSSLSSWRQSGSPARLRLPSRDA